MRLNPLSLLVLGLFGALLAMSSRAQETTTVRTGPNAMVHMPGTPECFVMAAQQGDPSKEASILKMRGGAGCAVPWHWHPATENIMMVSGIAKLR